MTDLADEKATFLARLDVAINDGSFVRLTLGKVKGDAAIKRADATPVTLKRGDGIKLVTQHDRKDITETFARTEFGAAIAPRIGDLFHSATLATTSETLSLVYSRKGRPQLTRGKPISDHSTPQFHDRQKQRLVDASRPYLTALGVTTTDGRVKSAMAAKFRQIDHFVHIVDDVLRNAIVTQKPSVSVVDIGSGKGYLTFALYDHLTHALGKTVVMRGIELRQDLVDLCNDVARACAFDGLRFEAGAALDHQQPHDIVVALHACDTATDDAIHHGVASSAEVIICAPCCQHEIATQIKSGDDPLSGMNRFGLFKQRYADLVTDAARTLLLEASGYKVRVIEFVASEHTAKNILLTAVKSDVVDRTRALAEYRSLKNAAGYTSHHLERLLGLG